ncbi:alpha/beta hydrolase [Nonomuraea muscovyensis]
MIRLPTPTGTHAVGVRDLELGSQLLTRAWYPAPAGTATPPRAYAVGPERELLLAWTARRNPGWDAATSTALLADATTNSHADAPVLPGRHPVIVFSHGADLYPAQNTALMEELASHGFMVVSVLQRGGGFAACPDGSTLDTDQAFLSAAADLFARIERFMRAGNDIDARFAWFNELWATGEVVAVARDWRDRMIAVADALEGSPADDLVAACDLSRLAYAGMSLGGSAAVSAAHADPRARAAVNLDGVHYGSDLFGRPSRVPILALSADQANVADYREGAADQYYYNDFFYEDFADMGLREDIVRIKIKGTMHRDFTDLTLIPGKRHLDRLGSADGERVTRLVSQFTLEFLRRFVLKEEPEWEVTDVSHIRAWARRP